MMSIQEFNHYQHILEKGYTYKNWLENVYFNKCYVIVIENESMNMSKTLIGGLNYDHSRLSKLCEELNNLIMNCEATIIKCPDCQIQHFEIILKGDHEKKVRDILYSKGVFKKNNVENCLH